MRAGPGPRLTAPDSRDTWVQSRPPARGLRGCGRGPGPPAARPCRPGCPGPGLRGPRLAPAAPDGVLSRTRPPGPLVAQPLLFPEPPWPAGGRQVQEARAARGAAPRTARRRDGPAARRRPLFCLDGVPPACPVGGGFRAARSAGTRGGARRRGRAAAARGP